MEWGFWRSGLYRLGAGPFGMATRNIRSPAICWLDLESLRTIFRRGRTSHRTTQPNLDRYFYAHPDQYPHAHSTANCHTYPQPYPATNTWPLPIADPNY
jgi:hypothetical protein